MASFLRDVRTIVKRIIVTGDLVLQTPAVFGSGDTDGPMDMMLARDSISERALLPGATLAGALRSALRERLLGYGVPEPDAIPGDKRTPSAVELLFGGVKGDDDGSQSPLLISDALSSQPPTIELRDGVRISGDDGTAHAGAKYDLETLAAGTRFPLCFELLIQESADEHELKRLLATTLFALEDGTLRMGMKKNRGFGQVQVVEWQVWVFDLTNAEDQRVWLCWPTPNDTYPRPRPRTGSILDALGIEVPHSAKTPAARLRATFALVSPLLIRAAQDTPGIAPDVVHLHAHQQGTTPQPVIPGTSWAGVLRHRATRIAHAVRPGDADDLITSIFGPIDLERKTPRQSRLVVGESIVRQTKEAPDLVQTRIAIDRFTGGVYPGALFNEQPIWPDGETTVELDLTLYPVGDRVPLGDIGLLLLLLKDLWTGDLTVGGTRSIGRGQLAGRCARLDYADKTYWIKQTAAGLAIDHPEALEDFVSALSVQGTKEARP